MEWLEEKIIGCGSDQSMYVILVIEADFGALRNIHSVITFSYSNSFSFLVLFCLNTQTVDCIVFVLE